MAEKARLSDAIEDFMSWRKSASRKAAGTMRNDRMVLRRFLLINGDLLVASLEDRHVDKHMEVAGATRSEATLSIDHATLSAFFRWAVRRRMIGQLDNPMTERQAPKGMPVEKRRVPVGDFDRLLDAAAVSGARDRTVVALGLHLFLRGSEVADLRYRDVRLDERLISVRVWKTKQIDQMPISPELDAELRRWLTYYSQETGPIRPDWFLVPARARGGGRYDPATHRLTWNSADAVLQLNPVRPIVKIEAIPQRALERIGWEVRDLDGKSLREGMHTLRRSGARAFFDTLREEGYDGAMRDVQAMLHHSTMEQTERYLGLSLDRVHRNERVQGKPMFGNRENVVSLNARKEGLA